MKKKILLYINTLEHGGAERVLCNLANQFLNAGNEVVFVASYATKEEYSLNSRVERYNLENFPSESNILIRNIQRSLKLRKIVKKVKPDIVISFLPEPNFRAIAAVSGLKTPIIISVRNDPEKEYANRIYRYIQKRLYPRADGIVFQTEDAKDWFPKVIQEKSRIIMNQVDERFFISNSSDEQYYCAIGRLVEQKNYKMLIESFSVFAKKYPKEILRIYGAGSQKEQLQKLIQESGMKNNIYLMGITDNVPEVLSKTKVFVMTSNYEGMPNALLEAMAVGVPVISTDCPCGGPKMIIKNWENGVLVPIYDNDALVNALLYLQEHKCCRDEIKEKAKKTAERFRPERVFYEWDSFVNFVICNTKKLEK